MFQNELSTVFTAIDALDDHPTNGVPLPIFATQHWGNPHALDDGKRAANLILGAIALRTNTPGTTGAERSAADIRRLWRSVGVKPDELSSTVTSLGLTIVQYHPLADYLNQAAARNEPVILTLDQIRRHSIDVIGTATKQIRVVENPSILAEAARRGSNGVFVCTSGWPSTAVMLLLETLSIAGCDLLVHADFDQNGLGIVSALVQRFDARPWAMTAADYLTHVPGSTVALGDQPIPVATWDLQLQPTMGHHGRAVFEEQTTDRLL